MENEIKRYFWGLPINSALCKKKKKKKKKNTDMIGYVKEMRACRVYRVGYHSTEADIGILARLRL